MRHLPSIYKAVFLLLTFTAIGLLVSCAANDPYEPELVANSKPTARFFVAPFDDGSDLSPTSYFERTFRWSGSDSDGWVTEYYISIRNDSNTPEPWITTTTLDTTMTFSTNENGGFEATFYVACKDNRGAYSDTLVQYVPLRNFPPTVNFKPDFEPLVNMQREFSAGNIDTTYWNFGSCNFRFFALDQDGSSTMDDFYRYTLMDVSGGDPDIVFEAEDPNADPELGWVKAMFSNEEIRDFEILISGASPSPNKTLTISVSDATLAETRFSYSWEVRAPKSDILYIPDNSSTLCKSLYTSFMNDLYGEGQWDTYDFWYGFPDSDYTLLETMRLFDVVLWTDGGSTSAVMELASARDGAIQELVKPSDGSDPGKFFFISKAVSGSGSQLESAFITIVLGISPTGAPPNPLGMVLDKSAEGLLGHLPDFINTNASGQGMGMVAREGTEDIYRMEYCRNCYAGRRPPFDPVVGVRWPERSTDPNATVITMSIQLEYFDESQVLDALQAIVNSEFGVATP